MAPRIPLPAGFNQYRKPIGNMMSDLGYGISQGGFKKGFGIGAGRMAEMAPYRAQEQQQAQQQNQTVEWLRKQAPNDPRIAQLLEGVEMGSIEPADAFQASLQYLNEKPAAPRTGTVNDRLVNMDTGALIADFSDPPEGPAAPSGYQWGQQGSLSAIPGGPADNSAEEAAKQAEKDAKIAAAQEQAAAAIGVTQDAIDRALAQTNFGTTGVLGAAQGMVPGSPGYDLRANIDTIKANLGFEALRQMRQASPTGGALGSITERELAMLQSTISSLDANQSEAQLAMNLKYIRDQLDKMKPAQAAPGGTTSTGVPWSIE